MSSATGDDEGDGLAKAVADATAAWWSGVGMLGRDYPGSDSNATTRDRLFAVMDTAVRAYADWSLRHARRPVPIPPETTDAR